MANGSFPVYDLIGNHQSTCCNATFHESSVRSSFVLRRKVIFAAENAAFRPYWCYIPFKFTLSVS